MTAAHRLGIEELEARILYSADAALLMGGGPVADVRSLDSASAASATPTASHWLVVDRRVEDWDLALADRQAKAGAAVALSVQFVEADENGQTHLAEVPKGDTAEVLPWTDAQGQRWLGTSRLDAPEVAVTGQPDAPAVSDRWETEVRHELVIIDGALDGASQLAMDWWSRATAACQLDVVVTDPAQDGLAQITALLSTRQNLAAVHLVSHGDAGLLRLGTTTVDAALLQSRAAEVSAWHSALVDGADLLVYGCDVAQGLDGAAFVNLLAGLTGADVAASDDLTGATDLGGDWALEYRQGVIAADSLPDAQTVSALQDWQGVLNTYTVTNLNDSGAGSLRQAIINANAHGGADTITFSALNPLSTINLASALPQITGQVTINGTVGGAPGVALNGGNTIANGLELVAGSDGSTIRGLILQGFTNIGLSITSSGNTIAGNYVGTDFAGNAANGNAIGINVFDGANNVIGGTTTADRNVISGNTNIGVNITSAGSAGTVVQGNYIGANASGSADIGNTWHGVFVNDTSGVTIGGTTAGAGNLVSGNGSVSGAAGVTLGATATGNTVAGNVVGLNAAGTGLLANAGVGIYVLGSGNTIGGTTDAARNVVSGNATMGINISGSSANGNTVSGNYLGTSVSGLVDMGNGEDGVQIDSGASGNTIGGLSAAERNVISGNNQSGVVVNGTTSVGNVVVGNYIGLAVNGTASLANADNGISIFQSTDTVIGSTDPAGRNVIANNGLSGIAIPYGVRTIVQGNYIGTDATGTLARGNALDGITMTGTTNGVLVGGAVAGAGNLIANNGGAGVLIYTVSGKVNTVIGNTITANGEIGIDLGADNGVTANDVGDGDTGANGLQNFPVLASAASSPSGTTIVGTLNSTASATFRIDFFASRPAAVDGTGYGEGERYLGSTTVTTNGSGNATINTALASAWVNNGDRVTATATRDLGGGSFGATSEFALNVTATAARVVVVDTASDTVDGITTSIANLGNNRGGDGYVSLREALLAVGNDSVGGSLPDKIVFAIRGTGTHTITLGSLLPTIGQAVDIDATTDDSYAAQGDVPAIVLDGGNVVQDGLRLYAGSDGSSVRGLNLQRFTQDGIDIASSDNNTVAGNWFGVATDGVTGRGNQQGVNLWTANNNVIGGASAADRNVISANSGTGVWIGGGATGNQILGNYIGTTAVGNAALGNSVEGILIESAGNTVGGTSAGQRNVIAGNGDAGIMISTASATGNVVIGNYIGTDSTGTADLNGTAQVGGLSGVVMVGGASGNRVGTNADGSNDTAERNVISGNNWFGVEMIGSGTSNNVVQGNYIGTDVTGLLALGNSQGGVSFWDSASNNRVGSGVTGAGNVISGNETGVLVANGVSNNVVQGNLIGLGADGSTAVGNTGAGVYFYNGGFALAITGNLIGTNADGSNDTGERNIISANYNGVVLENAEVAGNTVAGNYIGTDVTGLLDRGNTFEGVRIAAGATGNTVGGTLVAQRNVISGNGDNAVQIADEATDGNTIRGNWLGVNAAGTGSLGNGGDGIFITGGADNSVIGGTGANSGNWIAGAGLVGIEIDGAASGTVVQGNRIGTDLTGTDDWGSRQNGILVENGATNNLIGGTVAGAGNVVAYSGRGGVWTAGIAITGNSTTGNAVLGNSVYSGDGLGIDLGTQGVRTNDTGDVDTGANNLQNFPVLATARTDGSSQLILTGTLNSNASSYYRIEFFANTSKDSTGYGEGQRYLGYANLATDASGNATISTTLSASVAVGEFISATATKSNAAYNAFTDTSEFARDIVAVSSVQAVVTVDTASDTSDGDTSSLSTLLSNKGADGFISLREAITAANNTANGSSADKINFAIAGTGVHTITVGSALPTITGAVVLDASTDDSFAANGSQPAIVLDGNRLNVDGLRLSATADGSTIRGLVINNFWASSINIDSGSSGNTIVGNYLGHLDTSGHYVGGLPASSYFVLVNGDNNVIGGANAADRNVFASSGGNYGLFVVGAGAFSNRITGNYFGTDATGNAVVGGAFTPVALWSSGANNQIGGSGANEGNVFVSNGDTAVLLNNASTGTLVQGNRIGVSANGSLLSGVGTAVYVIGGDSTSVLNNWIAGTSGDSVVVNAGVVGATIQGNRIGTDLTGTANWGGQSNGLYVAGTNALIGGTGVGQGNIIANSNQAGGSSSGVSVAGGTGNALLGNLVYDTKTGTGGLGIDLGVVGVTANDVGDADTGANNLQNFPVLTSATSSGVNTTVVGSLNSNASTTYRIEFFSSPTGDASGYGEGAVYLGATTVTTNAGGNANFSATLTGVTLSTGHAVSATATVDLGGGNYGSTSEFAANVLAPAPAPAPAIVVQPLSHTSEGQASGSFSVVLATAPTADVTIAVSVDDPTELSVGTGTLTFTPANWNIAQVVTVSGVDDTIVDGDVWSMVTLAPAVSADAGYNGLNPADVSVQNADNDTFNTAVVDTAADTADGDTSSIVALYANKGADGFISLREAITAANNTANGTSPDKIVFDIGAALVSGAHTINLASTLPTVSDTVVIDASTEPDFAGAPVVNVSGGGTLSNGLTVSASNSTIRGLSITGFTSAGILLSGNGNTVAGNWMGVRPDNSTSGAGMPHGILVTGSGNLTGGGTPADRNIIVNTTYSGVFVNGGAANNNIISGNYFGLLADGTTVSSLYYSVTIQNTASGTLIGTNGDGVNDAGEGNLFGSGTMRVGPGGMGTLTVAGNRLGLNAAGAATGSGGTVQVTGGTTVRFGTNGDGLSDSLEANVVAGNINVSAAASNLSIAGNFIGVAADGSTSLGNTQAGITISGNARGTIGGTSAAMANTIASNAGDGIAITGAGASVSVLGNAIRLNGGLGIDLSDNGVTPNDVAPDADTGPNGLQNFPVMATARTDGSSQIILTGTLNSIASSYYRIEFFANTSQDATGYGEGQRYLGYANVATDASGNATISTTLSASVAVGEFISATATKSDAIYTTFTDTSEFGRNIAAVSSTQAVVTVDTAADTSDGDTSSLSTLLANKGADGRISLREAITAANNSANGTSADKITFAIAGTGVHTITLGSALPTVTGAVVLDASTDDSFAANGSRPAIELNGNGNAWSGLVLDTGSDGSTLRGLSVVNFGTSGVKVLSTGNTLEGLYAGLRADGTTALANGYGIWVQSSGNTIGGTNAAARNVLSGNNNAGLMLQGTSNIVYGNYIGTDYTGTADVNGTTANALRSGVVISGSGGNQVGGTLAGQRNVISGNNYFGVELLAGTLNNTVAGNYIGTDVTGLVALGNTTGGARFWGSSTGNLLGGNTIAGNTGVGVQVGSGANGSLIQGNYIGVGADGSTSLGNSGTGIEVGAGSTRIGTNADGSNDAAEANTISANSEGIRVFGAGTNGTVVYGNYIGTDASGMLDRGNLGDGVIVLSTAGTTTIGGATTTHRNIISGNAGIGVHADVANVTVQGNFIGLNATGTAALGNDSYGIDVGNNGTNATVRSNVVSGNGNAGVLFEVGSSGTIKGNLIGTNAAGTASIAGNGAGIFLASSNVQVGGTAVGEGNTVSGANAQGIIVTGAVSGDAILGNVVYGNAGLAIDLGNNGVTSNDSGDGDAGVNNLQNFPVMATARTDGSSQLNLTGTLNSAAGYYRIEFFANTSQDATGYGEGQRYLGYANVATDASGNATISTTLSASVAVGEFISATATKSDAIYTTFTDTSEFGRNIAAVSNTQATVAVDTASDTADGDTTSLSTLLANKGADGFISLREAITAANNSANGTSVDKITFAIAGTGVHTITLGTALPSINDAVVLDASTDDSFAANADRAAIVLDGNGLNASGLELAAGSGGSTVRGFSVVDFAQYGLLIQSGSDGNTIEGNLIGLGADGSTASANVLGGVVISSSGNTVGGTTALARNVLSGNGNAGLAVLGSNNAIIGNYLGTDATGTLDRGNWQDGVFLSSGSGNRIGGTSAAERNVISGNDRQGIEVFGVTTTGTLVQGNYIGTDVTGTRPLGNAQGGIWVGINAANNTIGGTAAGAGNLIAWNQGSFYQGGVLVDNSVSGLSVLGNAFQGNTGLAIDLGMDGLTANDAGDTDTGANALQNTPLLYSADIQGADVRVRGEVNTTAGTTLRIEFFSSPLGTEDPTGYGEGAVFLGYTEVTTDSAGHAAMDVTLTGAAPASGDRVSATATVKTGASTYGATSEFSMNVPAAVPNQAPVITLSGYSGSYTENAAVVFDPGATLTDADNPVLTGGNLTYQVTANGTATDELGLRHQGSGAGQIGLSGSNVTYGGVVIGTYTGFGNGSTPLVVTFNGNATTAAVQALLRNVTYRDTSDNPSTATRSLSLTVNDGRGGTSTPAVVSMAVVAVNDAPVLTNGSTLILPEGITGMPVFGVATLSDADNASFNGGTLTATISAGGESSDVLQVTAGSAVSTSGANVLVNGVTVGTWSGGTGGSALVVSFDANATVARVQAVYEALSFSTASDSPTAGLRMVSVVLTDGSGGTSNTATGQVNLTAVNDAPVFSNLNGVPVYTEGGAAVVLDADVTVSDAELTAGNNFSGATLTLARNGGASAQDQFSATGTLGALTEGGNLVVGGTTIGTVTTNSAGTLVLTFNTSATNALVNAAMQQIAYANSSSTPPASVTIDWTFSDGNAGAQGAGGALSVAGSTTVTVSAVNNAPTAPAVTRYLSDLTPLAASIYTLNLDADHGGGPIVLDGTTYAKGLGMHPGAAGDGFGYLDYAVSGATAFKAVIGVNDFQSGTYGTVRFHVCLDGVEVYTSPAVTSASDLIALDIDTTGASTLRLAVDNGNNGNAFDHAVWAQARLEGGTVALDAVPEGAANGTVVGSVASTDPDASETLTYSLTDSAGGRFAVQATTGQLTVADGSLLDAESAGSHAIVVRVTDSGGLFRETALTVQVSGVNEAPALGGLGGGVTFTEGTSAVVLAPAASLTDPELSAADNFSGATLTLARHGGANAEDQLAFDGTTVTVSGANLFVGGVQVGTYGFTGGQLDISLGSGATQARVNTLLQNIVYWNASDTPPASVQIDWAFNDGNTGAQGVGGVLATTGSVTVSTLARNDAPTGTDGRFTVAEDGTYTFSAADFGFSDVEGNAFLAVQVTTLPAAGVLQLAGVEVGAGQVVGVADLANLRFVPNPGLNGTAFTTFTFQVIDDGGTSNGGTDTATAPSTITFDVTSANDAPLLALGGANLVANGSFEAGAVAWTGNSGIEMSGLPGNYQVAAPPDGSRFAEVEGWVSSGVPSYLEQVITTEVGQTYVFSLSAVTRMDVNTLDMGMLSVDGVELGRFTTSADWGTYAVRFTATSTASTVRITSLGSQTGVGRAAGDGGGLLVDDVRLVAVDATSNFTEDAPAVLLAGGARVVDAELGVANDFSGATLTLARSGGANAQDQFSATGTLGALSEGGALVVGGTTIGTVTANSAGTLVLTFDASATNALVNAAMQQIAYANSSDTPPATVQIDWTFSDGNSAAAQGTGGPLTATGHTAVAITAVNDAPVLTMSASSGTYVENDPAVSDAAATVSDVDSADFGGGVLTYAITANGTASDELAIRDQGTGVGQIGLSGNTVTYGGVAIGTHAGFGNGNTPLVVTFNSNADAAAVQAVLRNITYRNTSDNPDSAVRTVQIDLTDGDGGSATPFIGSLAITPVNDAPVITSLGGGASGALSMAENTTAVVSVTASDVDLGTAALSYSLAGGADASLFAIDATTGALRFLSAPDYETPSDANADNVYDVTVQVSDGSLTASQAIAVTVTDVNDNTPAITSGSAVSVAENTTSVVTVTASDADRPAQTLTFSIIGGADGDRFMIDATTGALSFVTAPDYEAPADANTDNVYDVTVQVSDGSLTASQLIAVTVTDVNDNPPVITSGSAVSVAENATSVVAVTASDADQPAQTLTFSITGGSDAARFTIDAATGALSFRTVPDYEVPSDANADNVYDVTVQVSDGSLTASQAIAVTVTDVNDNTPAITSGSAVSVVENATAVMTVTASDADQPAQTLTFSIIGGADAARFTIDAATGVLSFRSAPDYEVPSDANSDNVYDVTVQVSDGSLTASHSIAVSVVDANDNTPTVTSGSAVGVAENAVAVTTVTASDADQPAQTLTFSITGGADAARFTIDVVTGALSFRTVPDYEAPTDANADNVYDVTVQVSDGSLMASQSITVTVTDVNDNTPAITSGSTVSVAENAIAVTTVTATDIDQPAQTLTFSITGGADAARFTIDAATGALSFRTAPDYEAPSDANADNVYDVTVQVSDGSLTGSQSIAVTVTDVNDNTPTIATGSAISVAENATAVTTLTASDADLPAQTLTFSITGGADAARFTIDVVTGALSFRTLPDYEAPTDANADNVYDVTVQVSDGSLMASRSITVTVTDVNDNTPAITSGSTVSVAENAIAVTTVTATDIDQPAQTLTFSITGGADAARFTIDAATGVLSFRSAPDYEVPSDANADNVYDVTVQVSDGSLTASQAIAVTVTDVNDNAPVITSGNAVSVVENATSVVEMTASDADRPAQVLTFSITGGADAARFTIDAATGVLSFRSAPDYEAPSDANADNVYDVTVQVSDGGLTASQAIAVTVTNVNDNTPTFTSGSAVSVAENATAVMTVTASDSDQPAQTLTFSIAGGADASRFTIDAATGALSFRTAPDYEAPSDANADNVYDVTVQVSDGSLSTTQAIAVAVSPVNDNAPQFTSDWAMADVSVMAPEGERWSAAVSVADTDLPAQGLRFDISGGADAGLFDLDPASGLLTFRPVADFEAPQDANRDNAYEVEVTVGDGEFAVHRTLTLLIANVNEAPVLLTSQVSVGQSGRVTLDASMLQSSDPDTDATALVYTVSDVRAGAFVRAAASDQVIERFTQAEVLAGEVVFVQSGEGTEATGFDLTVSDGGWTVGPRRVTVQVQPAAPTPTPTTELAPTLGTGFATAPQDNNLVDEPLTGSTENRVRLDQIMIEIAGTDSVPTSAGPREELATTSDSPAASTSTPATTATSAKAAAGPARQVGPAPDLLPGARATAYVGAETSSVVTDLSRLPVSDLLVMLDVPIDLSGFIQDRMVLLQWGSLEERSKAAVESARQQHGGDQEPTLRWDSGDTVQAGGMALSVGLVFWATRASGLVASLAAVAPPWRQFDPLPVLSVHAPRQPEGTEVEWLDTDISGSLADLAEDILDHRT